jgi:hypothetical protein
MDLIDLFIVRNGFECDMRDAFVDKALLNITRSNDFSRFFFATAKATEVATTRDFRFFLAPFS